MKLFFLRERDLPHNDLDGRRVEFDLSGNQRNEGQMSGTGKFDLIPCPDGLVRLAIHSQLPDGSLVRIPMRPVFLSSIKRSPPGTAADFSLNFRR